MAGTHQRDPWLLDLAAYFGPAAEYGMWLERDVLHIPAKIRYFTEDSPKELGLEIFIFPLISSIAFIAMPIAGAMDGYPVSLRRTVREGCTYLGILWVWTAMVSATLTRGWGYWDA